MMIYISVQVQGSEHAMAVAYHVHLLDLAPFWDGNATINNVKDLLNPWSIATKMVQDVPIVRYSSCSLLMLGGRTIASMWMPPAAPARMMRFVASTLVLEVTSVRGFRRRSLGTNSGTYCFAENPHSGNERYDGDDIRGHRV
jgi:hypothetical protein